MFKFLTSLCLLSVIILPALAQPTVLKNAKVLTAGPMGQLDNASIVIENGKIVDFGVEIKMPANATVLDMTGKVLSPGIVAANTTLGVVEVNDRTNSNDSTATISDLSASVDIQYAVNVRSSLIPVARNGGITRAIVTPGLGGGGQKKLRFGGQAAIISTGADQDAIIKPRAGVTVNLQNVKSGRGAVFIELRALMDDAKTYASAGDTAAIKDLKKKNWSVADLDALAPVANGEVPLIIQVDRASDISQVLKIARDLNLKLVLVGATEGWVVADEIAGTDASVILNPADNLPSNFDQTLVSSENAALLNQAGVVIAITGPRSGHDARLTRFHAGISVAQGLPYDAAIRAITRNPARMFGELNAGEIKIGQDADIAVWSGDPLEPLTDLEALYIGGELQPVNDRQKMLRKKYIISED